MLILNLQQYLTRSECR